MTLAPGSYTAILRGKTNGIGLVEVYDLESTSATHLVNISTRVSVGPDDNTVLIGGFIIDGQVSQQVLIRAIGPSLSVAGVEGALADPTIDKESAILVTLDPGSYTAVIRGKNNTTGVALVEVYQMP